MKPKNQEVEIVDLEENFSSTSGGTIQNKCDDEHQEKHTKSSIFIIKEVRQNPIITPAPLIREQSVNELRSSVREHQRRNNAWVEEAGSNSENGIQEESDLTLEEQRIQNEASAMSRKQQLEDILSNRHLSISWGKGLCFSAGAIAASVLCMLPHALIFPSHNRITHPEYWYEPIYAHYVLLGLVLSIFLHCVIDNLMNIKRSNKVKSTIIVFVATWLTRSTILVMVYILWSVILKYPIPMPFMGPLIAFT